MRQMYMSGKRFARPVNIYKHQVYQTYPERERVDDSAKMGLNVSEAWCLVSNPKSSKKTVVPAFNPSMQFRRVFFMGPQFAYITHPVGRGRYFHASNRNRTRRSRDSAPVNWQDPVRLHRRTPPADPASSLYHGLGLGGGQSRRSPVGSFSA